MKQTVEPGEGNEIQEDKPMAVMQKVMSSVPRLSVLFILHLALILGCVRHDEAETRGKPVRLMHLQRWFNAPFKLLAPYLLCCVEKRQ